MLVAIDNIIRYYNYPNSSISSYSFYFVGMSENLKNLLKIGTSGEYSSFYLRYFNLDKSKLYPKTEENLVRLTHVQAISLGL